MGICQSNEATERGSFLKQEQTLATEYEDEPHIKNRRVLKAAHSSIGLDEMAEERKTQGHLWSNVVNISIKGREIQQVYDGVDDGPQLGVGIAGVVRLVTHKKTGIKFAVKCLDISRVGDSEEKQEQLRQEIISMSQLDHPNICRLHEVYEDDKHIYLIQELGEGGELFDVLEEQPDYHYQEQAAVKLVHQMLSALRYLHSKGIIHRDLKLENFLYSNKKNQQLKLIGKCILHVAYLIVSFANPLMISFL